MNWRRRLPWAASTRTPPDGPGGQFGLGGRGDPAASAALPVPGDLDVPGKRRLAGWALAGAAGAAALLVLHEWTPSDGPGFTICPLRRMTGLPCPGCGMTRALAHLAKGEWSAAIHDHPLAPLLAAEVALLWAAWGAAAARLARLPALVKPEVAALCHVALLVAVWLGRMAAGTLV